MNRWWPGCYWGLGASWSESLRKTSSCWKEGLQLMLRDPGTGRADRGAAPGELVSAETLCCLKQVPVALERDLLKYLPNMEAARIKFLLGFYFPPPLFGSLRSLSACCSHSRVDRRNGLWPSLLFMTAPPPPQKSRCLRLAQGKSPGCMLCKCLTCI